MELNISKALEDFEKMRIKVTTNIGKLRKVLDSKEEELLKRIEKLKSEYIATNKQNVADIEKLSSFQRQSIRLGENTRSLLMRSAGFKSME